MSDRPTVFVVDDDPAIRDSLALLMTSASLAVETYESASAFLAAYTPDRMGCVILDVQMSGMNGPELQAEMAQRRLDLPIVFLTAHGDIPTSVRAMKMGAVDFLTKPVIGSEMIERVHAALQQCTRTQALRSRMESLTKREQEVMAMVVNGLSNKEIARRLDISHRTVEIHRTRVMQKTGAANLVELSRMLGSDGMADGPSTGTPFPAGHRAPPSE